MKMSVIGPSAFTDKNRVFYEMSKLCLAHKGKIERIIVGDTVGAAMYGIDFARSRNIRYDVIETDWHDMSEPCSVKVGEDGQEYNSLAGFKVNDWIVRNVDLMLVFWDDRKFGPAWDTLLKARKRGVCVKIIHVAPGFINF